MKAQNKYPAKEPNPNNNTIIHEAVFNCCGNIEVVQKALNTINPSDLNNIVNAQNEVGSTALHFASLSGYVGVTKLLLQHMNNAGINAKTIYNCSVFHYTTLYNYTEIKDLILARLDQLKTEETLPLSGVIEGD